MYMLRDASHKYVHHAGDPAAALRPDRPTPTKPAISTADPQIGPSTRTVRATISARSWTPRPWIAAAKADQARRIEAGGGLAVINKRGPIAGGTPAPDQFRDA